MLDWLACLSDDDLIVSPPPKPLVVVFDLTTDEPSDLRVLIKKMYGKSFKASKDSSTTPTYADLKDLIISRISQQRIASRIYPNAN